eukprot:TRINITY_DN9753_c0_g1_i1.p1 TRINITY_DN9753_c0_g1~~TRINITY_DN9753_c0_g1_i1.p1  ORF type:complete len:219 (-),score=40.22 TRINITY_DN9753_c0_g1_i1:6-662(-)
MFRVSLSSGRKAQRQYSTKAYDGWTSRSYWDTFYDSKKDNEKNFDWFLSSSVLSQLLPHIQPHHTVLHIGCGTSKLGLELYEAGRKNIHGIDISQTAIDEMNKQCIELTTLKHTVMDIKNLDFEDHSFDIVLDKGTLDTLIYGKSQQSDISAVLNEIHRVLKPKGKYLAISDEDPELRLPILQNGNRGWNASVRSLSEDDHLSIEYFLYVLTKDSPSE